MKWICLFIVCSLSLTLHAQDYSYIQYTTKDGLPGSTVHGITQDQTGFLWFATEAGLSRFDGRLFRTFTITDGLPSNEVLFSFCDSRNRVWIASFKNAICYYYNGKIYNQHNDPLLRKLMLTSRVRGIVETSERDILIHTEDGSYLLPVLPSINPVYIANDGVFTTTGPYFEMKAGNGMQNRLILPEKQKQFVQSGMQFRDFLKASAANTLFAFTTQDGVIISASDTSKDSFISYRDILLGKFYNDSIFIISNSTQGVKFYDFKNKKIIREYLPQRRVQDVFKDKDNNLWFSTKGAGIFRLNQHPFVNFTFGDRDRPFSVYQIQPEDDHISVVTEKGQYWKFKPSEKTSAHEPLPFFRPVKDRGGIHKIKMQPGKMFHFYDINLQDLVMPLKAPAQVIKTAFYYQDTVLLATSTGAFIYGLKEQRILDTLLRSRATCAAKVGTAVYIGTIEGLYAYQDGALHYLGARSPLLRSRISTIAPGTDGIIWIGTYEEGAVGLKNGMVARVLNGKTAGLSNNVCRCLFVDEKYLWIGTENGLNKVDISIPVPRVVRRYDLSDGLPSNNVNAVYVDGTIVYTGSPEGISCFDESKVPLHGSCTILFTGITVAGSSVDTDTGLTRIIRHQDNSIRFDYAGLSFAFAANVSYRYRLLGLSDQWFSTGQMYLDYPSLPSGKYKFQIVAVNKSGDQSRLLEQAFVIEPLLWERKGVQMLAGGILMAITGMMFQLKFRSVRKKDKEQQLLQKKIAALEQKALRAQMNPHFIFNCLNSIQHFIVTNDAKNANFYLVRFAGLVRSTLEHASHMYISLAAELDYLSGYLDLEQMQASPPFSYTLTVDPDVEIANIMTPNMLIQPFLENAIKHGVSRLAGAGEISVIFSKDTSTQTILCVITDNGPGVNNTIKPKDKAHTSKGIFITRERIDILNQVLEAGKITLDIRSAFREQSHEYGTKVTLTIPILYRREDRP